MGKNKPLPRFLAKISCCVFFSVFNSNPRKAVAYQGEQRKLQPRPCGPCSNISPVLLISLLFFIGKMLLLPFIYKFFLPVLPHSSRACPPLGVLGGKLEKYLTENLTYSTVFFFILRTLPVFKDNICIPWELKKPLQCCCLYVLKFLIGRNLQPASTNNFRIIPYHRLNRRYWIKLI